MTNSTTGHQQRQRQRQHGSGDGWGPYLVSEVVGTNFVEKILQLVEDGLQILIGDSPGSSFPTELVESSRRQTSKNALALGELAEGSKDSDWNHCSDLCGPHCSRGGAAAFPGS